MARPAKETASPSTLAPALLRWLERDAAIVLAERTGLEPSSLDADDIAITAGGLAALLAGAAEILAEPHVALRLPSAIVYRRYDAVALAANAAATPEDVLRIHARFAALVFPQLEADVTSERDELRFGARVRGRARGPGLEAEEYIVALVLARCRRGGVELAPRRVSLASARPRDLGPLYATLGTREIAFGSEATEIVVAVEDARRALPGADAMLVATAEHLASEALASAPRAGALADSVAAKIDATLPEPISADAIAASLHMSARTLQRRLEAEGARFSEVLDRVRERRARKLLLDADLALAEIAYRAGFADLATFSRAFKRWTGVPPGAFRRSV